MWLWGKYLSWLSVCLAAKRGIVEFLGLDSLCAVLLSSISSSPGGATQSYSRNGFWSPRSFQVVMVHLLILTFRSLGLPRKVNLRRPPFRGPYGWCWPSGAECSREMDVWGTMNWFLSLCFCYCPVLSWNSEARWWGQRTVRLRNPCDQAGLYCFVLYSQVTALCHLNRNFWPTGGLSLWWIQHSIPYLWSYWKQGHMDF